MKNSICKTVCALTVLAAASSSVMAAESIELKVTGTITPAACIPTLTGDVKYDDISADDLTEAAYHDLGIKSTNFTITCDGDAKFAVKAVNSRLGSVVTEGAEGTDGFAPAPINLFGASNVPAAGLGMNGSNKIGGFAARITNVEADSSAVDVISSGDRGLNWSASSTAYVTENDQILSWAATTTTTPIAAKIVAATLEVNAYLNKPEELDLTNAVHLDGLATIEVVYL